MQKLAYNHQSYMKNFLDGLEDPEMKKEAQNEFSRLVRSFVREDSFAGKIIPPQEVTIDQLQISTNPNHEGFEWIGYKEPDAAAQYMTFQGTGDSEYVYGERFSIPIGTMATRKFEKSEDELLVYKGIGLIEMIEQNAAKELANQQDDQFMGFCRNAVQNNGLDISSGGQGITKNNFLDLLNAPLQAKIRGSVALMTETTFNNFLKQGVETFGDSLQSDIIVNGYKAKKLLGFPVITTIKNDIVDDNEVFAFPAPEFLGHILILEDTKYTVKKEDNIVSWSCRKKWGMAISNINAVARLRLNGFGD